MTLTDLQIAAQIAAFAVVFSDVLTQPKMILESYGHWVEHLETTRPRLAYPLGYCAKCTAGQITLWCFLICLSEEIAMHPVTGVCRALCAVSVTILLSSVLSASLSRLTR